MERHISTKASILLSGPLTLVVMGDDLVVEQVRKQLAKIVSVVKAQDYVEQPLVVRELMLLSLAAPPEKRPELCALVEMFRGRVVDIGSKTLIIEVSGPESKIEAFVEMCRPYGIKSLARTGTLAMPRPVGASPQASHDSAAWD